MLSELDVDTVSDELVTMIGEIVGDDFVAALDIGPESSFATDIEMESIEFVALAEMIRGRYGDRVDFITWTAQMDVDEILGLTIGRLVDFIVETSTRPDA